jgi:glycosyltransferase involved in cell wall biosynthesis
VQVSIIIPAYNSERTIAAAIESAVSQNFPNAEIVVVDDGSTDATPQVLEAYEGSIKVKRQANAGAAAARNAGVAASVGEYLAFLDADDLWLPRRLERTVSALETNPDTVMAFGDYIPMDESGRLLEPTRAGRAPSHRDLLQKAWPILTSAVTVRRSAFEKAGGFCEEFKGCGGDDPYMWLLLSEHGQFEYVAQPLMIYRLISPVAVVEKYERGRQTFARLVAARYGVAAEKLVRGSQYYFSGMLLKAAVDEIDAGNLTGAATLMCRAFAYRPSLALNPTLCMRLFNIRNAKRIAKSFLNAVRG